MCFICLVDKEGILIFDYRVLNSLLLFVAKLFDATINVSLSLQKEVGM